ncbi:hypothetical protein GC177_04140 [bacterium]|nr:hypothetical protein [bacterium]
MPYRAGKLLKGVSGVLAALLLLGAIGGSTANAPAPPKPVKWVVYYGQKALSTAFNPYQMIVLETVRNLPVRDYVNNNKTVLGYVSLGEVHETRWYFADAEKAGMLLAPNANWPESRLVDMRNADWPRLVVEEIIPEVLFRGVNGIFIDTMDNASYLEQREPAKYKGMKEAAVRLIHTIRLHYPQIFILMNRGFDVLPEVAGDINGVLGESLYTTYDFKTKTYSKVPAAEYQQRVSYLKAVQARYPHLKIFTLDYWDPAQPAGIREIYAAHRAQGFHPYVATVELNRIIPEPPETPVAQQAVPVKAEGKP